MVLSGDQGPGDQKILESLDTRCSFEWVLRSVLNLFRFSMYCP